MIYNIKITESAKSTLKTITDKKVLFQIARCIEKLKTEPHKQGKPLIKNLQGFRSLRAVSQRYRIIYRILEEEVVVFVVAIGIRKEGDRKDIYELVKKLIKQGVLSID